MQESGNCAVRIGLHDSDGMGFPNLALMKLASWHRARGDSVEWWVPMLEYDRVYSSKVFTFTSVCPYLPENTVRGGYGVRHIGRAAAGDRRHVPGLQHLSEVQTRHRVSDAGVHTEVSVVRRAEEGRTDTALSNVAGGQAA